MRSRSIWHPWPKLVHMASLGSNYYEKVSVVKGHHIYKAIWTPMIGEELPVQSEDNNYHNEHTIAVMMDGLTYCRA